MTPPPTPSRGPHDASVDLYVESRLKTLRGSGPIGNRDRSPNPSKEARRAILSFLDSKKGEVGRLHFRNYVAWLPVAADRLGEEFLEPRPDVQARFNAAFPSRSPAGGGYSFFSRQTVGGILMGFWRYRLSLESKPFPDHLRLKFGKWKTPYNGGDMLTRDDVAKLAESVDNFRDRAWIWTCYASACRPGEIYTLRVGDVVPKNGYVELRVRREKDSDNVPALLYEDAVPAILAWLKAHPGRSDPKSPLWVSLRSGERGRAAGYRALYKVIEVAAKRASLGKPVTLYHLRRSRLTELAKDPSISQSILEKVAGWTTGSKVAKHYVHLNAEDVRSALGRRYGVSDAEPASEPSRALSPRACARCETVNTSDANFCSTCGGPLNLAAVGQAREIETHAKALATLLRRPAIAEFLARELAKAKP
ncbi:MAG: site-specific integrase [Thermoplasmata archaeon]|nr:site-specific integrase [Thermoplasmata archaeon]